MKTIQWLKLIFLFLSYEWGSCQSIQVDFTTGITCYPESFQSSSARFGFGVSFIPGINERWFMHIGWDFYLKRNLDFSQELFEYQNLSRSGLYVDASCDLSHFGGRTSLGYYLRGDAFSSKSIYLELGFKYDIFTTSNLKTSDFDDSLYFLYGAGNRVFPGTSPSIRGETDWYLMGISMRSGYIFNLKRMVFRPIVGFNFYFNVSPQAYDIVIPKVGIDFGLNIGYIFEDIRWSGGYRVL